MTLLEMLVSVSILVVIIFGLTAAFNQTQRIFMTGLSQTDTLEGGRAALDLIRRDIEPAAVLQNLTNGPNGPVTVAAISLEQFSPVILSGYASGTTTNFLEKFFLMRQMLTGQPPTNYLGVGYRVLNLFTNLADTAPMFVGTLYRFSSDNVVPTGLQPGSLLPLSLASFVLSPVGRQLVTRGSLVSQGFLTEVLEGVVHFQVNFYDQSGNLMTFGPPFYQPPPPNVIIPVTPQNIANFGGAFDVPFGYSTPAFVEIELGVMDPPVLEQFKARFAPTLNPPSGPPKITLPTAGVVGTASAIISPQANPYATFLANHLDNIHYYRTQVPIRTGLTAALP